MTTSMNTRSAVRLNNGDAFASLSAPQVGVGTLALPDDLAGSWSVVLFYRGHGCPFCRGQLGDFQKHHEAHAAEDFRVVALSVDPWNRPSTPCSSAAWALGWPAAWSDCGGDVERRFSKDELLTNLTIYWATGTILSSFLPYDENTHTASPPPPGRIEVPTGVALFPHDLARAPREYAERVYNLRRWAEMPRGGHFAALEESELLAEDIRAFFRPLRAGRGGGQRPRRMVLTALKQETEAESM